MKLYAWQGDAPNFGDALNALLWPPLLPGFFNEDDAEIVLGIGSVLDRRHPPDRLKIVLGAGYGGYEALPRIDRSWVIHWVRGKLTSRRLGIDPALGLGDPAMLWPFAASPAESRARRTPGPPVGPIGFKPHFESLDRGAWIEVAAAAGMRLIDPRAEPRDVVAAIAGCRKLVSEAMHGAIMADTLRVPWIAAEPQAVIHRAKWHDWASALGMAIRFQPLPASSLYEFAATSPLGSSRPVRGAIRRMEGCLRQAGSRRMLDRAAAALQCIGAGSGQLSEPAALLRCQERMLSCLHAARRHPRRAAIAA